MWLDLAGVPLIKCRFSPLLLSDFASRLLQGPTTEHWQGVTHQSLSSGLCSSLESAVHVPTSSIAQGETAVIERTTYAAPREAHKTQHFLQP